MLTSRTVTMDLNDIQIPKRFKKKPPARDKVLKSKEFYHVTGQFDKSIIVDEDLLFDGYSAYVAAQELGLQSVKVVRVRMKEDKPKYWFGKVVCVENIAPNDEEFFTPGKVYEVKDGLVYSNWGSPYNEGEPIDNPFEWDTWLSRFVEYRGAANEID